MFPRIRRLLSILSILAALASMTPSARAGQQRQKRSPGRLEGAVYNVASGDPLTKVSIEVTGHEEIFSTGVSGDYSISLGPGTYTVRFFREGFNDQSVADVLIISGESKQLDAALSPVGHQVGESVTVSAGSSNDVVAMLEDRKASTTISDAISALEISKDTASSAAGVLRRAPGVSVVDRFVFIRGLGERYSNTAMNDAIMPTTEPDRKVVPMDLIPANLLQNIKILKTFTPDQPGEFSGGLVRLETVDLPRAASLSVSFSLGFNSETQGKRFLGYAGGGNDFFGFGRRARSLPAAIPAGERVLRGNIFLPGGFTPEQMESFGESFENIWDPREEGARPELGWSVSGGRSFGRFGVIGALSFKNELQTRSEVRNFYQIAEAGRLSPTHSYDYDSSTMTARLAGTLNTTYEINKDHRLFFKNFLTNQANDETRVFEGFNQDRGTDLRNTRLRYMEERIYTGQASGNHLMPSLGDSILTWRYTYSRATLDEPDLRETLYEFSPVVDDFVYLNQTQSLFRLFNEMRENVREPAFDLAKYWFFGGKSLNTKLGASFINRDRVFDSRRFRFTPRGLSGIDTTLPPEQLLVPANIGQDRGFEIREETRTTDHYDALHNITSGYLMGDLTVGRWRFIGGARAEKSVQRVQTFEPFRARQVPILAELENTDWLPSVGVAYSLRNGSMALRGGYSRTVSRPQFRELSPFEFTDVTGGRSTVGNPDLERTLITNYDLRWEWFYSPTELLAVSAFYKDMENPIEVVVEPTAEVRTTYRNVDRARISGVELETRRNLSGLWQRLENLSVNLNYTFARSRVEIGEENRIILTDIERPLVGQAENLLNVSLAYDLPRLGFESRALYNFTGARITDVGALGLPNIVEHSYPHLDLMFAKGFGGDKKLRAEFTVENLLNRQVDYRLGDRPFRVYRSGRTFAIGLSYRIF
ncbi:MAG TPA: outer membrane beta-barrel protein [Blastocatellia bacterium]|nr:outer membrane beta-barrel protein [Blastocatellia bacterium]